jgi:transcriptional regulator GlxA family with amidase domain
MRTSAPCSGIARRHRVDKIAARLGFADASNFSRTFKGVDGLAPGEFRRNKQSA